MGSWLARYLERRGHLVGILDRRGGASGGPRWPTIEAAARDADVVVFATPIDATAPLLAKALSTGSDALIFDVLSLKAPIVSRLLHAARSGAQVTSVHPMFGPATSTLRGQNLLVLSCGNPSADRAVERLFAGSGLTITRLPIARHDRLIAETLGLAQAFDLLFLMTLGSGEATPRELAYAAGTTFRRHVAGARVVGNQAAALTFALQARNRFTPASLRRIRQNVDQLAGLLRDEDVRSLRRAIDRGLRRVAETRAAG
jgi:prephenate dehydrogenase